MTTAMTMAMTTAMTTSLTTMTIQVRYFAALREALGAGEVLDVAAGTSLAQLREQLIARGGRHAEVLSRQRPVRCSLQQTMVSDESVPLVDGAEVAFFPPVTGG